MFLYMLTIQSRLLDILLQKAQKWVRDHVFLDLKLQILVHWKSFRSYSDETLDLTILGSIL